MGNRKWNSVVGSVKPSPSHQNHLPRVSTDTNLEILAATITARQLRPSQTCLLICEPESSTIPRSHKTCTSSCAAILIFDTIPRLLLEDTPYFIEWLSTEVSNQVCTGHLNFLDRIIDCGPHRELYHHGGLPQGESVSLWKVTDR